MAKREKSKVYAFVAVSIVVFFFILHLIGRKQVNSQQQPNQVSQNDSPVVSNDPWEELRTLLPRLKTIPVLQPSIESLQNNLSKLEQDVRTEFALVDSSVVIDFIYSEHPVAEATSGISIGRSQAQVEEVLDSGNYDLIGIEAQYADQYSLALLDQDLIKSAREVSTQLGKTDQFEESYQFVRNRYLTEFAVYRYMNRHTGLHSFGIEEKSLHEMHSNFFAFVIGMRIEHTEFLDRLNDALCNARSQVALARAIKIARLVGAKRVGIPYGSEHRHYLEPLRQTLHVPGAGILALGDDQK